MKKVREVLAVKGSQVFSVRPDASVLDALALMAEKDIGALVIIDAENLVGIMPFGSVRANAGLSGSFYSAPSVYTFAGQSDPLQWSDSFQPSLRIMASVPEPRQWSMILSGLLVLGVVAHRRRRGPPRR